MKFAATDSANDKALSAYQRATTERRLVLLLAAAVFISNIDRGNLAIAGPLVRHELHLTATSFGLLISCFYWSYTACINPVAWLAERIGARVVLGVCVGVWSIATGLTSLAAGFASLILLRLLLGIGESGVFPCSSKLLAAEVSPLLRGRANGWLAVAIALGPAFGTFLGGLLMGHFGWRVVFAGLGIASIAWLWPWLSLGRASRVGATNDSHAPSVPLKIILRQPALWGTTLGNVCGGYTYYFMISWMPMYLVQGRGLSMSGMGQLIGGAYLVRAATSYACGHIIDHSVRNGHSENLVYKSFMCVGQLAVAACLVGFAVGSMSWVIGCLFAYEFFAGLSTTAGSGLVQTLAGPRATGPWVGFQNTGASLAGIVAPAITGIIVDTTGHFLAAFALAGAMAIIGLAAWLFLVPSVAPLAWAPHGTSPAVRPS